MASPQPHLPEVRPVSRFFRALGDETRVRIVALLSHGELCVCHVQAALRLTQSGASRQLSILRNAGIVEDRRDGTWVYYRLAKQRDPHRQRQLRSLARAFGAGGSLKQDLAKLLRALGPGACR